MTQSPQASLPPSDSLRQLADLHGVLTEYWDYQGNLASPSRQTLVAVLAALGVSASTEEEIAASLEEADIEPWRHTLPASLVVTSGKDKAVQVHVPDGADVTMRIALEEGGQRWLKQTDDWAKPRMVDGVLTGRASFDLPTDLPLGWHTLVAEVRARGAEPARTASAPLAVTPDHLELPEALGALAALTFLAATHNRLQTLSVLRHQRHYISLFYDIRINFSVLSFENIDIQILNSLFIKFAIRLFRLQFEVKCCSGFQTF